MVRVIPSSLVEAWQVDLGTNATSTSLAALADTTIANVPLATHKNSAGPVAAQGIFIKPFGVGSGTFVFSVVSVSDGPVSGTKSYTELYRAVCTLGSIVYTASPANKYCSAIAAPTPVGTEGVDCVTSNGNPAAVYVDLKGSDNWYFAYDVTAGATSANCMFRRV